MVKRVESLAVLAVVAMILGACSSGDEGSDNKVSSSSAPATPAQYRFLADRVGDHTHRWSVAEGVDINSPEASLVRAVEEGVEIALPGGPAASYPGYAKAIVGNPGAKDLLIPGGSTIGRDSDPEVRQVGTFRSRIVSITPGAAGFRSTYCVDRYDVAQSKDSGKTFKWWNKLILSARTLTFERTEPVSTPFPRGGGPERVPKFDVFTGWKVVDAGLADQAVCRDWLNARHPDATRTPDGYIFREGPADPPKPEQFSPGWPKPATE